MSDYQKKELISVDEALARGRSMLLLPRILLIMGIFFFLFPTALIIMALMAGPVFTPNVWFWCVAVLIFTFFIGFYLPFRFWSKRTTRWKLWAFDNVTNVHELNKLALRANLFAAYGTVMDKLQVQSADERERWRELQDRNNFPEVFVDDQSVPPETIIYFSTPYLIFNILLGLIFMAVGIVIEYFAFKPGSAALTHIVGIVIILIPLYFIFSTLRNLIRHQPQLILNSKGLYTVETGFLSWDIIYGEEVQKIIQGRRGIKYILHFNYMGGIANIDVTLFATTRNKLEKLIRVYRGRFAG